jgi:glycosyltransferase involved in cell wall biosynthesis
MGVDRISVIIPARDESEHIAATVAAVLAETRTIDADAEVIVVDDGSTDSTWRHARGAGARVVRLDGSGNPGAARNRGVEVATGDTLVFLDADCLPTQGWLAALVAAHDAGESCVGGALALPPGLSATARWDYYFTSYHVHPRRDRGPVPNHTPANLSVRRDALAASGGFTELMPVADGHEELAWQAALRRAGGRIYFEPRALVYHHNRPGLGNLLRRTYRWAYSAIQAKTESGAARWGWLYRHPWLLVTGSLLSAPVQAVYIAACWLRARTFEPTLVFPALLLTRLVYAAGATAGGWRWLVSPRGGAPAAPPGAGPQIGERPSGAPRLSAAVCTRDRAAMAARAVASLVEQGAQEVLVVDNAPTDDSTRRLLRERFPQTRYLVEPSEGLDIARNCALREATGDIVAFLDDDAVAAPGWAAAFVRTFEASPLVAACTGRVEALKLETPAQRLFEANGGYSRGAERIQLPDEANRPLMGHHAPLIAWAVSIGSGCSFALRRQVALSLGGFDEALDLGSRLPGGGDHDMIWRLLQSGYKVVYEPEALAYHEHRREPDAVFAQLAGHQRGLVAFLAKAAVNTRGSHRLGVLAFLFWRLLKPGLRLARRIAGRDPLPARALWRMWGNTLIGGPAYFMSREAAKRRSAARKR